MLDSPYVRRVAIFLQLLDLRFEHRSISVFSTFAQFQQIHPDVKAPSLICDDGQVLMDSMLILECAEALAGPRKRRMSARKSRVQRLQRRGVHGAHADRVLHRPGVQERQVAGVATPSGP